MVITSYFFVTFRQVFYNIVLKTEAEKEMEVRYLDWEDPLEEGTSAYSSILAWRIPGQRSMAGYSP